MPIFLDKKKEGFSHKLVHHIGFECALPSGSDGKFEQLSFCSSMQVESVG